MFRVWSPRRGIAVSPLADFTPSPNTRLVFLSRGPLVTHLPSFMEELRIVPLNYHAPYHGPLEKLLGSAASSSSTICANTGRTAQIFAAQGSTCRGTRGGDQISENYHCGAYLYLEAQQRYFSYRAMPVAIVSQNSFVLVFMGYRTIIPRYVAKWGIARMCLCKIKYQGGVSHHFGGVLTSLKKCRAIWGIAAIVSQYRAIWDH